MIKKTIVLIFFILLSTASAQEDVHKIVLKYGKHQDFYRFVFVCEKAEIAYSINVNLLNDGKIKLTFINPFEIEFEGRVLSKQDSIKDLKIYQNERTLIIGTSNITKIKVSRYESPSRLIIDAYFEELPQEEKFKTVSVLIDPGHGGDDSGVQGKDSNEKNMVLYISKEIASRLAQKGIKASLTRATDENLSLTKRLKIESNLKPYLFVSIHLSSEDYFIIYTSQTKKNIPKSDPSKVFLNEISVVKVFSEKIKEKFSEPVYFEKLPATLLRQASAPVLMIEIPKRALFSDKNYINKIIDTFVQAISEHFKTRERPGKSKNE